MINVNGYGIPSQADVVATVAGAIPEGLAFPRWNGLEWVSDEGAYAADASSALAAQAAKVKDERASAYVKESDPLFFKAQRGEATEQEWLDKVAEIKARYPIHL